MSGTWYKSYTTDALHNTFSKPLNKHHKRRSVSQQQITFKDTELMNYHQHPPQITMKIKEDPLNPPQHENTFYPLKREGTLIKAIKQEIGSRQLKPAILSPIFFSSRSESEANLLTTPRGKNSSSSVRYKHFKQQQNNGSSHFSKQQRKMNHVLDKPRMRLDKLQDIWDPRSSSHMIPNMILDNDDATNNSIFGHHFKPISRSETMVKPSLSSPRRLAPLKKNNSTLSSSQENVLMAMKDVDAYLQCNAPRNTPSFIEHEIVKQKKDCLCLRCKEKMNK